MAFATDGKVGLDLEKRTTTAEFKLGSTVRADSSKVYIYVGPSTNAISAAATATVTGAFVVNNTAGNYTADTAFATGEYGFIRKTAVDV